MLEIGAVALYSLAESLGGAFVRAINILVAVNGRVVVTGIGKSGHVARKIASTLASTGSPSLFVHPAEASHGDLGMIATTDAVIALSNSGETPELTDIIAYTRRFAIPLIAITGRADSNLAEAADVALVLPKHTEACPLGLAPTTSTTMMLALGDALAVALLERHGFSVADFRRLHPGGRLGQRLLRVADLMHSGDLVPVIGADAMMAETILVMTSKRLGCVGVVGREAGQLLGIITDGDLRRHMSSELLTRQAGEVMTQAPKVVSPQNLAAEAVRIMNDNGITALFVVENERPVGVLHIHDCLRAGVA